MKKHSVRPQDKPQSQLRIRERRTKLMNIFAKGATVTRAQKELAKEGIVVSRATVGFDLQALGCDSKVNLERERESAYRELRSLQRYVADADDMNSKETVDSLLAIRDRINRLIGCDAPTKSISAKVNADVDPDALVGYRRFVAETRGLDATQIEAVYKFARSLVRPTITVTDVPEESELL